MKARKEITLAVIIGLLVGLVVVGGIVRARSALQRISPPDISLNKNRNKSPEPTHAPDEFFLTITTPDNQVLETDTFTVEGNTLPGSYVVILGEVSEYIIVPSDTGHFAQEVKLVSGANTITVTSYQESGNHQESTITAVYTTAEI